MEGANTGPALTFRWPNASNPPVSWHQLDSRFSKEVSQHQPETVHSAVAMLAVRTMGTGFKLTSWAELSSDWAGVPQVFLTSVRSL